MVRRELDPRLVVGVVYVSAMFMNAMDSTVVNVALPTLGMRFGVPPSQIDGVIVGYLVSLAVFIPASGWLGDRFGTKRIFLVALAVFTGASALCGVSQSLGQLVLFRVIQGAGGGMLTPTGMAMLYRTFPPEQRAQAARILVVPTVVAPAAGPVLGGLLIDQLSWRWIFYVNLPIGCAAFLFGLFFLHEHREPEAGRFDLPGFLLAAAGFAPLMYALTEGPSYGWTSPRIVVTAVLGVLLLAVFALVELRAREPLVQLRLLKDRLFLTCNLVSMVAGAAFLGVLFLAPLFLQDARGASALTSGLTTFPEAIGVVISMQIVARLYPHVGPRRLMAGGMLWVALIMVLFSRVDLHTSDWAFRGLMFLVGSGMAYVFLSVQAAAFTTITPALTGRASTLYNAGRQLGAACGVALLSGVLAIVGATRTSPSGVVAPHLAAYHAAFIGAALLALLAALLALMVPDAAAAPSMIQRGKGDASPLPDEIAV
jgi:EmrB/QacA subfamily drug resistance transporter